MLFLHYAVPPEALRAAVPPGLPLELREGRAWLSVVLFEVHVAPQHAVRAVAVAVDDDGATVNVIR